VAYSIADELPSRSAALELVAQNEQIIPESSRAMAWVCSDFGMQMALSRDVPELVARELGSFLERLRQSARLTRSEMRGASYAVHPGGPKILDLVGRALELEDSQLEHSRKVLRGRGNMSSATLPHVWQELLRDPRVSDGQWVVSLAFGPGLTICGAIVRKVSS
jgi:predicted naringenin-chalcone synthase